MRKWLAAALLIFIPFSIGSSSPEIKPERTGTLIFSSNVWGEVEPCG
jgi:hypothetical protein